MKYAILALLVACRPPTPPTIVSPPVVIEKLSSGELPPSRTITLDTSPKAERRAVAAEVFLRAYMYWFGTTEPREAAARARGDNLFDLWSQYLAALGLPDYHVDSPRVSKSNAIMLATIGRLGEALCVRTAERELGTSVPVEQRRVFAFDSQPNLSYTDFVSRFDVLHRTFLGYPFALASPSRGAVFYAMYQRVEQRHRAGGRLPADRLAWAAVCTALVQHPEAWLY